jgi:glycosyltransferase involved in cell wall biosynthesis
MKEFPALSETFVYREILELRRLGFDARTFAVRRPPEGAVLSRESLRLIDETHYLTPLGFWCVMAAGLRHLLRRPLVCLRLLLRCQLRRLGLRDRLKACYHFLQGLRLASFLQKEEIDHIHCHFATTALAAQVACALTGRRYSFTAHHHDADERSASADTLLLDEKIKGAHFIVAISEYMKRLLLSRAPEAEGRIHVIHLGVDTDLFLPAERSGAGGSLRLLSVGRLAADKDHPTLIAACRLLKEKGKAFTWHVIGGGPEEERLKALCEEQGVDEVLHFMGAQPQERLADYFNKADIFVLSSLAEGVPVVLMESLAKAVPVVATSVGGVSELITDEEEGLLVAPSDPPALADAVARLMEDAPLRARLGQAGRLRVMKDFNLHTNALLLGRLFTKMLAADGGAEESEFADETYAVLRQAQE